MRQTLFFIPHSLFEGPLLVAWLIIGALVLAWLFFRHGNTNETWSFVPIYAIVALAIYFVLPRLEIAGIDPQNPTGDLVKQGLGIRGYGMFLLLALVSGIGIVLLRCRRAGLTPDQVLGLGFWMMLAGIAGARLFFIIQKSDDFFGRGLSLNEAILNAIDMTKGGLVVYGSLFGGVIAAVVYLKLHKLPLAKTADLVAPAMVLGLAIGRLGCLMNGCCFGGVCESPLPAVTFPAGSAPYMQQLTQGALIGVKAEMADPADDRFPMTVTDVETGSVAEELGVVVGDQVDFGFPNDQLIRFQKENTDREIEGKELVGYVYSQRQGTMPIPVSRLPARSRWTHPTQIYSAINAGLLCLVLWFYWTVKKSDGEVFGLLLILYPIGRFLMELIRQDELGQFGTELTISQWVSIATILIGFTLFAWARAAGARPVELPAIA